MTAMVPDQSWQAFSLGCVANTAGISNRVGNGLFNQHSSSVMNAVHCDIRVCIIGCRNDHSIRFGSI